MGQNFEVPQLVQTFAEAKEIEIFMISPAQKKKSLVFKKEKKTLVF